MFSTTNNSTSRIQTNNNISSSTQYSQIIEEQLNNPSLGIASRNVTLSAKCGQGNKIIVEGNATSGFTFSRIFYKFLETYSLDGISLIKTTMGKIIGFKCDDIDAYQKLMNVYAEDQNLSQQDIDAINTPLNHRQIESTDNKMDSAQYIEAIAERLNNPSLKIASNNVTLSAECSQGNEITIEGNATSGFTFSKIFYHFLETHSLEGISLILTKGGKIIGFKCDDIHAYQKLMNVYAEDQNLSQQDVDVIDTPLSHRQIENSTSEGSYAATAWGWASWVGSGVASGLQFLSDHQDEIEEILEAVQKLAKGDDSE